MRSVICNGLLLAALTLAAACREPLPKDKPPSTPTGPIATATNGAPGTPAPDGTPAPAPKSD
ncbi:MULTISPECIES: hypothetical protein [Polyangium]|uniref:Uncharacterized protein n=2 Tax=Polyangium TaxID=55 RepID=A0A4U1JJ94_9BACT|nr:MULTISPECIES: hypothetical protein [Polyangium]MDI1432941.1 hypothetical protein [Polyangium sorediatum]TKD12562.1 hypothetical protein E8A74_02065 [Polyangium fumosum]